MLRVVNQRLAVLLALCSFFPLAPTAGEFWLEKPPADWSEKEAETILSNSPWGKDQMSVLRGKRPWGRAGTDPVRGDATGRGGSEGERRQPVRLDEDLDVSVIFRVVWYSSTKVQEARSRLVQLRGLPQSQAGLQKLDLREHYIVAVDTSSLGSDRLLKIFEDSTLELLKSKTRLVSKKRSGGKRVELKEYVAPVGRNDAMALFLFSRKGGEAPALDPDDGEVQFVTEIGPLRIKTSFKLSRMIVAGKLDL